MGVHTGDSITVAPAMTLTDREYQTMRDAAVAVIREIGVEAGGCNIQFAVNPANGEMLVIEMNPRVSRSSALASKATGFPIARIGAKLAVGYRLDEIPNDITKTTPASFEPVLDYVVVKCPRFAFEKFTAANPQPHDADEVGRRVDGDRPHVQGGVPEGAARARDGAGRLGNRRAARRRPPARRHRWRRCAVALRQPTPERIFQVKRALRGRHGSRRRSTSSPRIDPWFLAQMRRAAIEAGARGTQALRRWTRATMRARMKRMGFSDRAARRRCAARRRATRAHGGGRWAFGPRTRWSTRAPASFRRRRRISTAATTRRARRRGSGRKSVVILGSGPNRIGQGVEFDYCCVRAALALREQGYETIMINSNPETVSTDFDISDKLYFEPLTLEDVLEIVEREQADRRDRAARRADAAQAHAAGSRRPA